MKKYSSYISGKTAFINSENRTTGIDKPGFLLFNSANEKKRKKAKKQDLSKVKEEKRELSKLKTEKQEFIESESEKTVFIKSKNGRTAFIISKNRKMGINKTRFSTLSFNSANEKKKKQIYHREKR